MQFSAGKFNSVICSGMQYSPVQCSATRYTRLENLAWSHTIFYQFDKTPIVTKLKLWQNLNCNKTQIATKTKFWQLKLWQNSNKDKFWQHSNVYRTQIVRKLKLWQNLNWDKTQMVTKLKLLPELHKVGPAASSRSEQIVFGLRKFI